MALTTTALGRAIDAYISEEVKLTKDEKAMLARLRASKEAAKEVADMHLSEVEGFILIRECVEAHGIAWGGHKRQVDALRAAPDPRKARKALEEVERFFHESLFRHIPTTRAAAAAEARALASGRVDEKSPPMIAIFSSDDPLSAAIALLAANIRDEEQWREDYEPTISRKGDKKAAESRAIGRLKDIVSRLSGRSNLEAVRVIAVAVLGKHDCDIDPKSREQRYYASRMARQVGAWETTSRRPQEKFTGHILAQRRRSRRKLVVE
jgi:cell pole-organizing protein PopZ